MSCLRCVIRMSFILPGGLRPRLRGGGLLCQCVTELRHGTPEGSYIGLIESKYFFLSASVICFVSCVQLSSLMYLLEPTPHNKSYADQNPASGGHGIRLPKPSFISVPTSPTLRSRGLRKIMPLFLPGFCHFSHIPGTGTPE